MQRTFIVGRYLNSKKKIGLGKFSCSTNKQSVDTLLYTLYSIEFKFSLIAGLYPEYLEDCVKLLKFVWCYVLFQGFWVENFNYHFPSLILLAQY